jgi:MoxR-like ATPase
LLTGEPGSGKTLAARWIADRLGLADGNYEEFQVRSDSKAKDLRYEFDAVGWFRASQIAQHAADKSEYLHPRALGKAFGWNGELARPYVVLVDEIDKAPRDFPNDLLLELDQMRFTVDEDQRQVGPPSHRPVIIITSNSERRLPDPFLRRCVLHRIDLGVDTVMKILTRRLAEFNAPGTLLEASAKFWTSLEQRNLERKPTIAEFWQWLALESRYGQSKTTIEAALADIPGQLRKLDYVTTLFSSKDLEQMV